jgi:hypothetical protein
MIIPLGGGNLPQDVAGKQQQEHLANGLVPMHPHNRCYSQGALQCLTSCPHRTSTEHSKLKAFSGNIVGTLSKSTSTR